MKITPGGSFAIPPRTLVLRLFFFGLATVFVALLPGVPAFSAQMAPASLTFTKTLKGSSPEYLSLSIDANGTGTYDSHKLDDPSAPRPIQISAGTTTQIFSLVQSLNYLRSLSLDSRHKVANMGLKTLTYQNSHETNRVQFNYTEDRTAQQLTDILEKISNVEERIAILEYAMKYDHLSLPQYLQQVQEGMNNHYFVETELMVPTLEKISSDPHYLHLAQSLARQIELQIQQNR